MLWHGKNFRGIINKAKQMIFDNTGTNLISTNAEDAIKEVNSNLSGIKGQFYSGSVAKSSTVNVSLPSGIYFVGTFQGGANSTLSCAYICVITGANAGCSMFSIGTSSQVTVTASANNIAISNGNGSYGMVYAIFNFYS